MAVTFSDLVVQRPQARTLLTNGLLPEILPPVFTSQKLASPLNVDNTRRYRVTQSRTGKLAPYNASKRGQQRRVFSVPHPLFHFDASLFFERNWDTINKVYQGSKGSASKPRFPVDGFRAVEITPQAELPTRRLQALARKRYCLITDVSRCFPSIYTHAIPWALDGKAKAKLSRREGSKEVKGNRLDFIVRQAQDGQTAGIPVGPDTSRLISELILSRVDADYVQQDRKKVYFVRHVDDYWIGGDSIDDCERHLRRLRLGLGEYQLDINESKTRIVPLSHAIGETWPTELKNEISEAFPRHRFGPRVKAQDITALLSKIIDRSVSSHDDGIIKYAIRQIDRARSWDQRWDVLEPFLAHCAIQFPHSFDYVARVIAWRARRDEEFDSRLWKEVALTVAAHAAELGHDSELTWALWLLKELRNKLTASQGEKLIETAGPLVLALLAHMSVNGLAAGATLLNQLEDSVVGDDQFSGSQWPLTLELYHLGHGARMEAYKAAGNAVISSLHASEASIIDWDSMPRVFERDEGVDAPEDWEPEFAIEDYASAYDEEEDEEVPF